MNLKALQDRLGYQFKNEELLEEALTHPSYGYELRRDSKDNQRLEFLGDAVLQLAVTDHLYHLLPNASEGELTPLRAQLVNRERLRLLAEELELGKDLILGKGEEANEGRSRPSNLADAMEAILGAVFHDGGWEASHILINRLLSKALADTKDGMKSGNPKGDLQEKLQAQGAEPPQYICISESGPPHARQFEVSVQWQGKELGRGIGPSKKEAETKAAEAALGIEKK